MLKRNPKHTFPQCTYICATQKPHASTYSAPTYHMYMSGWGIVLHADAAQMGKCCDPIESGMSTFMYSSRFCLISSITIMWNIYDGERSTWIKFIKLHTKSRQSFGQQIFREVFFISIQPVKPRSEIWMAWVHWYKRRRYNRNHHQVLAWKSLHMHMLWIIEHCCGEVKTCVQNTKPKLWCHHSASDTVLHPDATQMGKCCDVLELLITLQSSSMGHKVILLHNVMFWQGYNAGDPHSLVVVSSSQRENLGSAPPCIPVDYSRFHLAQ